MGSPTNDEIRAEIAADKVASEKALPQLFAQRQELEKESGALGAAKRKRLIILSIFGGAAAISLLYTLWVTSSAPKPPVIGWVVTVLLAAIAGFLQMQSKRAARPMANRLEELHQKMHSIGRRIAGAERNLRK